MSTGNRLANKSLFPEIRLGIVHNIYSHARAERLIIDQTAGGVHSLDFE